MSKLEKVHLMKVTDIDEQLFESTSITEMTIEYELDKFPVLVKDNHTLVKLDLSNNPDLQLNGSMCRLRCLRELIININLTSINYRTYFAGIMGIESLIKVSGIGRLKLWNKYKYGGKNIE